MSLPSFTLLAGAEEVPHCLTSDPQQPRKNWTRGYKPGTATRKIYSKDSLASQCGQMSTSSGFSERPWWGKKKIGKEQERTALISSLHTAHVGVCTCAQMLTQHTHTQSAIYSSGVTASACVTACAWGMCVNECIRCAVPTLTWWCSPQVKGAAACVITRVSVCSLIC